jgi:hypothetical protein
MPGPAPKPAEQRRRRNAPLANTVKLPAEGRSGVPPAWPLGGAEPISWPALWATPQAAAWERLGWTWVVARYARALEHANVGNVGVMAECRQLEDRLGLSPMAMLRLRWEIAADEVQEQRDVSAPAGPVRRLTVAGA